jgi:hypothetical protein
MSIPNNFSIETSQQEMDDRLKIYGFRKNGWTIQLSSQTANIFLSFC